jgi:hypothetical protein
MMRRILLATIGTLAAAALFMPMLANAQNSPPRMTSSQVTLSTTQQSGSGHHPESRCDQHLLRTDKRRDIGQRLPPSRSGRRERNNPNICGDLLHCGLRHAGGLGA